MTDTKVLHVLCLFETYGACDSEKNLTGVCHPGRETFQPVNMVVLANLEGHFKQCTKFTSNFFTYSSLFNFGLRYAGDAVKSNTLLCIHFKYSAARTVYCEPQQDKMSVVVQKFSNLPRPKIGK